MFAAIFSTPRIAGASRRLDFIDTAKAMGIVLVVLGHIADTPLPLATLIYSVHMPLFFFISGYLLAPERVVQPLLATLTRALRTLLVPYIFFFAVSLLYWLLTRNIGDRALKFAHLGVQDAVSGLLTGRTVDLFVNPPLWFFPALFVCSMFYAVARRLLSAQMICGLALLVAVGIFTSSGLWATPSLWNLDIATMALVFYSSGNWLRVAKPIPPPSGSLGLIEGLGMVVLLVTWTSLAKWQGRVDLALGNFGSWPLVYVLCAMSGTAFLLLLARRIPSTAMARWLSDNSLVIFPLHALTLSLGSGLIKAMKPGWDSSGHGAVGSVLFATWAIAAVVPAAFLLNRYVPLALGRRG